MSAAEVLVPATDAPPPAVLPADDPPPVPTFDVHALLALLGRADLYVQDEVDVRHHPTLTRVWSRKGHHGQRQVRAPGWCSYGLAPGRTADVFAHQLDHLVERSQARGRVALVVGDNAKIPTPAYDPPANPTERLWQPFRRRVTHNHHRDDVVDLFRDAVHFFADLDAYPDLALRHIGSPFALQEDARCLAA